MTNFERDKAAGEVAERFIVNYGKTLLLPPDDRRIIYMLEKFEPKHGYHTDWPEHVEEEGPLEFGTMRKTDEEIHIEGGDLIANIVDPDEGDQSYQAWIEVKAMNHNAIIRFGCDNYPSLPFELISNTKTRTPGWLWHLLHPSQSLELRKQTRLRTIQPSVLVFCQYENTIGITTPYVVVSFYDFNALKNALIEIGHERYNWDLVAWKFPKYTPEQRKRLYQETCSPNWNVSLKWLQDKGVPMAIYMLDSDPEIKKDKYYDSNYLTLQRLKSMATCHYNLGELKGP